MIGTMHKKVCTTVNYIEQFCISGSTTTGWVSIFAFASLVGIPIKIASSEIGLKNLCNNCSNWKNKSNY